MKETLLQFARYNAWANKRMIDALLALPPEAVDKDISSSFPSLRKTVCHMLSAEYVWLQRLQLVEQPIWLQNQYDGSFQQACEQLVKMSEPLLEYVKGLNDEAFAHEVAYNNLAGTHFKNQIFGILQHVFNHSNYHRGQLVTMLRQLGETQIPNTDLIAFLRVGS